MKTMDCTRKKKPVVIPAVILAPVTFAVATLAHTGPQGTILLLWIVGLAFMLFTLWPEIRTTPRAGKLGHWAKRLGVGPHGD